MSTISHPSTDPLLARLAVLKRYTMRVRAQYLRKNPDRIEGVRHICEVLPDVIAELEAAYRARR